MSSQRSSANKASLHSKIRYMFWSIDARDAATRIALRTIFGLRMSRNRSGPKSAKSLVSDLETGGSGDTRWNRRLAKRQLKPTAAHDDRPEEHETVSHTIFEGTSELQQLVIARAISGLRIE